MATTFAQPPRRAWRMRMARRWGGAWDAFEAALTRDAHWALAIAFVAALQTALIVTHVPWLDELQALLIAWQSPDFPSLMANLRYEGHPPIWYLMLRAAAGILPFDWVLPALSLVIAAAAQALVLTKAPFSRGERLLLALSELMLVEYGSISRSLALGALLMLACAAFWRRRAVWLAIALLPMCDFLFGVLSLTLIALRWRERLLWGPGLAAWLAVSALAAWSVIPAPDAVPAEYHLALGNEVADFFQRIGGLGLPFQTFLGRPAWDGYPPLGTGGLIAVLLLIWWWQRTDRDGLQRLCLFGYIAFCFAFSLTVYALHFRHLTTIALLFLLLAWIAPRTEPRETMRLRIWLASLALCGLATAGMMLAMPFDAAPQAGAAIRQLDDGRRPWLSWPANRAPALYVATGVRFVQPEQGCSHDFARWNHRSPIRNGRALYRALPVWAARYGQSFLVLEQVPRGIPTSLFQPLSPTLRGYDGQKYVIGILGPGLPVRGRGQPPCVSGLRPLP